jgi:hypothetical protein
MSVRCRCRSAAAAGAPSRRQAADRSPPVAPGRRNTSAAPSAGARQIAATGCWVTVRTLCAITDFFYALLCRLQNFDLHLLLAEQPLELANPLTGFPQRTHRDDVLVCGDGRGGTGFDAPLPLPHHAGLDVQLARDLRQRLLALQQLLDDTPLEFHGEDASAVRLPWELAHEVLPSCRSRIAPSVSSSIGERIQRSVERHHHSYT